MKIIQETTISPNTGRAFVVKKGQCIRVTGTTTGDFVVFNQNDLRERLDQARTKANQLKIFLSTGDLLYSKFNNPLMTIVADTYKEGTHDLQKGMCSRRRWEITHQRGLLAETYMGRIGPEQWPDHGCWENLTEALKEWQIPPEDIPSPFNLFQTMAIDGKTGQMRHTKIRPQPGTYVTLRAEMDCLVGLSACPDLPVGGKELQVLVYEE